MQALFALGLVNGLLLCGAFLGGQMTGTPVWRDQEVLGAVVLMTGLFVWAPSAALVRPHSPGSQALLSAFSGSVGGGLSLYLLGDRIWNAPAATALESNGHMFPLLVMGWTCAWAFPGLLLHRLSDSGEGHA